MHVRYRRYLEQCGELCSYNVGIILLLPLFPANGVGRRSLNDACLRSRENSAQWVHSIMVTVAQCPALLRQAGRYGMVAAFKL